VIALQQIARFWRRKLNLRVIGITGSVGKSTTKEVIAQVLSQKYRTLKNPGNLNNEIGLPLTILRLDQDMSEPYWKWDSMSRRDRPFVQHRPAASRRGQQYRDGSCGTRGFTGGHRTRQIGTGAGIACRAGRDSILNFDDPLVRKMEEKPKRACFFYGLSLKAIYGPITWRVSAWRASASDSIMVTRPCISISQ